MKNLLLTTLLTVLTTMTFAQSFISSEIYEGNTFSGELEFTDKHEETSIIRFSKELISINLGGEIYNYLIDMVETKPDKSAMTFHIAEKEYVLVLFNEAEKATDILYVLDETVLMFSQLQSIR